LNTWLVSKPTLHIGTNAIDYSNGLTDSDWETIQVKKADDKSIRESSYTRDLRKLNSSMQMKIADVDEIDFLITELPPDSPELQAYKSKNLTIF